MYTMEIKEIHRWGPPALLNCGLPEEAHKAQGMYQTSAEVINPGSQMCTKEESDMYLFRRAHSHDVSQSRWKGLPINKWGGSERASHFSRRFRRCVYWGGIGEWASSEMSHFRWAVPPNTFVKKSHQTSARFPSFAQSPVQAREPEIVELFCRACSFSAISVSKAGYMYLSGW
jgi:hypothetical protein